MQFTIASVPNAGCSEDGQEIMARVQDAHGETIDLYSTYQAFEEVINALNEAQSKAHEKRRALGIPDVFASTGDTTSQQVLGFRYAVADDRSHMILQIQTATGRLDIKLDRQIAAHFRDATNRNCDLLMSPPRGKAS